MLLPQLLLVWLEEAAKGVSSMPSPCSQFATAVLHSSWKVIALFSSAVSTVRKGITNPKSVQCCELIELLRDSCIKSAKHPSRSL